MLRLLLGGGLIYAAVFMLGAFPGLVGMPYSAQWNFTPDVQYAASLRGQLSMRRIFEAFGYYDDGPHPIVMGPLTPGGSGMVVQLLDEDVDPRDWQQDVADGMPYLNPDNGPIKTVYLDDSHFVAIGDLMSVFDGKKRNYDFELEVYKGKLVTRSPQPCRELELSSMWLSALGVTPGGVSYCVVRGGTGKKAVVSFYLVRNGLIVKLYTDLTCALMHDAVARELADKATDLEHICVALRTNTDTVTEENPFSVRHYRFS
jgi:hypothetical protein